MVSVILNIVGINKINHVKPRLLFNLDIFIKNMQDYKNYPKLLKETKYIIEQLSDY